MGVTGLKARCPQGCISSGGLGVKPFNHLFQLLEAAFLSSLASVVPAPSWLCASSFHLFRTLMITLGPPR